MCYNFLSSIAEVIHGAWVKGLLCTELVFPFRYFRFKIVQQFRRQCTVLIYQYSVLLVVQLMLLEIFVDTLRQN